MTDKAPELPTESKAGRPSKAELDKRAEELQAQSDELHERELALVARAEALDAKGIDPNPAPIQPVSDAREHKVDPPRIAQPIDEGKKFPDVRPYLDKYGAENRLFWINDMNGDVQRWLGAGAEPVEVLIAGSRTFEGLTDVHESKWCRCVGGDDGMGNVFWVYLLMMPYATYDQVRLAPLRKRQDDIRAAIKRGGDQSQGAGGELGSYAPNLPTGGQGFEQTQERGPHQKITDHITGRG